MTGFNKLFLAIKTNAGGNYKIEAVMGPDTQRFANLSPVDPASPLRGTYDQIGNTIGNLLVDNVEVLTSDVWEILSIDNLLAGQKLLNFKITNNSGSDATFEVAFMRLV